MLKQKKHLMTMVVGSRGLNDALHRFHTGEYSRNQIHPHEKERILKMDDSFEKEEPSPEEYHTYSGIRFNPKHLFEEQKPTSGMVSAKVQKITPDEVQAHLPAFTSSSLSARVAREGFSEPDEDGIRHILKFKIPKGSKFGTHIDSETSFAGTELETLLNRGLNVNISRNPEVHGSTHIWHARITGHNPKPLQLIHPNASSDEINNHANSQDHELREAAAEHPNASHETLERLSKDMHPNVRKAVAKNNNTASGILHNMAHNDNDLGVLNGVANNYNTRTDTLHHLADKMESDFSDTDPLKAIARHPNSDEHTLNKIIGKTYSSDALSSVLRHANSTSDMASKIHEKAGQFGSIKKALSESAKTNPHILHNIATDKKNIGDHGHNVYHGHLLRNSSTSTKTLHHILDSNEGMLDNLGIGTHKIDMINHPNADSKLLEKMYEKNKQRVDDPYDYSGTKKEINAGIGKFADKKLLHKMIDDGNHHPLMLDNPNIDNEHLEKMLNHPNVSSYTKNDVVDKLKQTITPKTKKRMSSQLMDNLTNGTASENDLQNHNNLGTLSKEHIDAIANDPSLSHHQSWLMNKHSMGKVKLSPDQISKMISTPSEHSSDIHYSATTGNAKLKPHDIDHIINSENSSDAHARLVDNHLQGKIKLKREHLNSIANNKNSQYAHMLMTKIPTLSPEAKEKLRSYGHPIPQAPKKVNTKNPNLDLDI